MLLDDGVEDLLLMLTSRAFSNVRWLNLVATKLTTACKDAFVTFLGEKFPDGRSLSIDMRLIQYPRATKAQPNTDHQKDFKQALTKAGKSRPHSNFIIKF